MNRRTILIPLSQMDQPNLVRFMELIVEPREGKDKTFSQLRFWGLNSAINKAKQLISCLKHAPEPSVLHWVNPNPNISGFDGIALGLAIGSYAMNQPNGYRKIFSLGKLTADNILIGNGYIEQALSALSVLPPQNNVSRCLIMPLLIKTSPKIRDLLGRIQSLGIDVYPVATLDQAMHIALVAHHG